MFCSDENMYTPRLSGSKTTSTCGCTRCLVVVAAVAVVAVVTSTFADASSVLLHPDASLPLSSQQEGDRHYGFHNLSSVSPSFSALRDSEYADNGGFFLDEFEAVTRSDTLECPSANVITTRYKCQVKDQWVDCYRRHCCQGYNFVAGRCLPDTVDPCSQNFCEQKCSVYFGRVICTCFSGYRFSPENHKRGIEPVCLDIDECASRTGICQHECINEPGSFRCSCRPGFRLRGDNTTCELESEGGAVPSPRQWNPQLPVTAEARVRAHDQDNRCSASCSSVGQMASKIRSLEEKIDALSTAVRLYSFAAGLPGPEGPPGPPGSVGPRGFPGPAGSPGPPGEAGPQGPVWTPPPKTTTPPLPADEPFAKEDFPFDSWTVTSGQGRRKFCRCRRGAVGPPGAHGKPGARGLPGIPGTPGEKGDPGSFDFLNLIIADVRHDIQKLQEKVFGDDMPEPYDLAAAVVRGEVSQKQHRSQVQEAEAEEHDNRIFGAASPYHPQLFRLGKERREGRQPQDGLSNAAAMTEGSRIPLPSPRPLPTQATLTIPSTEEEITQEQVLVGSKELEADVFDGYYDNLLTHDDLLLEEYISHYDYGQLPEPIYISDYASDAPIPPSQSVTFLPSRTLNSAGPSATAADPSERSSRLTQTHVGASPARRSLSDDLANGEREGPVLYQSQTMSIDLFSSQNSVEAPETKRMEPTMALRTSTPQSALSIDSTPTESPRSTPSQVTPGHTNTHMRVIPLNEPLRGSTSTASPRGTSHDSGPGADTPSAAVRDHHFGVEQRNEELSSWQHRSNLDEIQRGQLSPQERKLEGDSQATGGTTVDEDDEDMNYRAAVSEINKSRIKETEKFIEILDDIIREVNLTVQLSRESRNPHSAYHPHGHHPPSVPPLDPAGRTKASKSGDLTTTFPRGAPGSEAPHKLEEVISQDSDTIPTRSTVSREPGSVPPTHSGTRGLLQGEAEG